MTLRDKLTRCFREYMDLEVPRSGGTVDLREADVDLFAEDAYLVGIATSFLERGRVTVDEIWLDPTVDLRLREAMAQDQASRDVITRFIEYRRKMRELAEFLSQATGLPLLEVTRN